MSVGYGTGAGPYYAEIEPARYRLWGSVFAGAVVSVVLLLSLNLLGISMGLGIPVTGEPAAAIGAGAGIWMVVSSIIALFAGGWFGSRISSVTPTRGVFHAIVVWAVAMLVSFYMTVSTAGSIISGITSAIGSAALLTETLPIAALWGFLAIVFSAAAAGFGGWLGASIKEMPAAKKEEFPKEKAA